MRIDNTGDANAYFATISIVGSDFTLTSVAPLPSTFTPGSGFGFTVGYSTQTAGAAGGMLIVDKERGGFGEYSGGERGARWSSAISETRPFIPGPPVGRREAAGPGARYALELEQELTGDAAAWKVR